MKKYLFVALILVLAGATYYFLLVGLPYIAATSSHCSGNETAVPGGSLLTAGSWMQFKESPFSWVIYTVPGLVYVLLVIAALRQKEIKT